MGSKHHAQASEQFLASIKLASNKAICLKSKKINKSNKLYHIMLYLLHLAWTKLVMIGTDYIGNCKSTDYIGNCNSTDYIGNCKSTDYIGNCKSTDYIGNCNCKSTDYIGNCKSTDYIGNCNCKSTDYIGNCNCKSNYHKPNPKFWIVNQIKKSVQNKNLKNLGVGSAL
jgi:hypothetical protein